MPYYTNGKFRCKTYRQDYYVNGVITNPAGWPKYYDITAAFSSFPAISDTTFAQMSDNSYTQRLIAFLGFYGLVNVPGANGEGNSCSNSVPTTIPVTTTIPPTTAPYAQAYEQFSQPFQSYSQAAALQWPFSPAFVGYCVGGNASPGYRLYRDPWGNQGYTAGYYKTSDGRVIQVNSTSLIIA